MIQESNLSLVSQKIAFINKINKILNKINKYLNKGVIFLYIEKYRAIFWDTSQCYNGKIYYYLITIIV